MEKEWKVINNFPQYEINLFGDVRNIKSKRILKIRLDGTYRLRKNNQTFDVSKQTLLHNTFEIVIEDLLNEIWKDIEGFEGKYQISNMGRCKSLLPYPTLLKPSDNGIGYLRIQLCMESKISNLLVHQLVGKAFLKGYGTFDECGEMRIYINHKNKDKTDNRYLNLEWVSMEENYKHSKIYNCLISEWNEDYPMYLTVVEEYC